MTSNSNSTLSASLLASKADVAKCVMGHTAFQYLRSAAKLGVFEHLAKAPGIASEDLGRTLSLPPHSWLCLGFGLRSLHLVHADAEWRIWNAPFLQALIDEGHYEAFAATLEFQHHFAYRPQTFLLESLTAGQNSGLAEIPGAGSTLYERMRGNALLTQVFYDYMSAWSKLGLPHLLSAARRVLDEASHVLDVGGGDATNAVAICREHPRLRVTLLDLEFLQDTVEERQREASLEERLVFCGADFFESEWPAADCVLFAHQLVIWDRDKNERLLRKAFQCLPPGGSVVLFSSMADSDYSGPVFAALDSGYFVSTAAGNGLIYSFDFYSDLLREVGFGEIRSVRCAGWTPHGCVMAKRP